jgi:hypothetical protein
MKHFTTIERLDTGILYCLELASSLSILLLAFGLIASMANVLTKGAILSDNLIMQRIWAITQCVAIDFSIAGIIVRTFQYYQQGEKVKTWLYGLLSVLLLFTAAIVLNIESVQQTLNITLEAAYVRVFVPIEVLIWIRSLAIVLLIVAHALRHVQVAKPKEQAPTQTQEQHPIKLEITPELLAVLRETLTQAPQTVIEEALETPQIAAPKEETLVITATEEVKEEAYLLDRLAALLPDVSLDDITLVVTTYRSGIGRRDMIRHLRWGGSKYTTIVKPVLDAYEQLQRTA